MHGYFDIWRYKHTFGQYGPMCRHSREIFDAKKCGFFPQMFQHLDLDGSDNNKTVCGVAMTNPVTACFK